MKELFEDIFGISLSEGTIDNTLKEIRDKAEGGYKGIKEGDKKEPCGRFG
jgi:hypothetical protein